MPIHDWSRVNAGTFHDFHLAWIAELRRVLNGGLLPAGYYALAEQVAGEVAPDVLTLQDLSGAEGNLHSSEKNGSGSGGIAVAIAPPKAAVSETINEAAFLAARRQRLVI